MAGYVAEIARKRFFSALLDSPVLGPGPVKARVTSVESGIEEAELVKTGQRVKMEFGALEKHKPGEGVWLVNCRKK